jgi:arginyl-tRNA synthetase
VRYFYLMRRGDSHLVFDVDLARSESDENPVYRVQMAHARMCGIFRTGGFDASAFDASAVDWSLLSEPAEQELATKLATSRASCRRRRGRSSRTAWRRTCSSREPAPRLVPQAPRARPGAAAAGGAARARARGAGSSSATGLAALGISAPERM